MPSMALFVAGAASMGALLLVFSYLLTRLMAKVTGETAAVVSRTVERIFWPAERTQVAVEPEPENEIAQNLDESQDWEPPWETEDMSPLQPSSVPE